MVDITPFKPRLILKFMLRMLAWGVLLGAGLGSLLLMLLTTPTEVSLWEALIGVMVGIVISILNGLLMGVLTSAYFVPPLRPRQYKTAMLCSTMLLTIVVSGVVFYLVLNGMMWAVIIVSIITALASAYASYRVATWYLKSQPTFD